MRLKIAILLITIAIGIAALLYLFSDKLDRIERIGSSVLTGVMEGSHKYYPTETTITDKELNEINISDIVKNIGKGITVSKAEKLDTIKKETELALAMTSEELIKEKSLQHTKAKAKKADFLRLEDLPQKFKPLKKVLHEPFKMGACGLCHMGSNSQPGKLVTKSIEKLCYRCHKTKYKKTVAHRPVKNGKCTECHDPHQSNVNNLLKAESLNELCMNCHKQKNKKGIKATISMSGAFKHKPAEDSCVECHEVHSANHAKLLKDDGKKALCLDCHSKLEDKIDMRLWINSVQYKHGAVDGSKRKCLECHNPHSSNYKGILVKQQVKLCLGCHNKKLKSDEDSNMLMNMDKHLKKNKNWHKPIKDVAKEGGCAACHNPHGSNHFSILRKTYSTDFYTNLNGKKEFICFKCHKYEKIESKHSDKTGFRDGNINLHFLHVNDKKGRACRVCHDEHASKYSHLIRSYTEFGGIKFPIRYTSTQTGGSCQPACHKRYEYDRVDQKNIYDQDLFKK